MRMPPIPNRPTGHRSSPYDQLIEMAPTAVVVLNRAVVIGEVHGPAVALAQVDLQDLDHYYPFHATRADLLRRPGRHSEAEAA